MLLFRFRLLDLSATLPILFIATLFSIKKENLQQNMSLEFSLSFFNCLLYKFAQKNEWELVFEFEKHIILTNPQPLFQEAERSSTLQNAYQLSGKLALLIVYRARFYFHNFMSKSRGSCHDFAHVLWNKLNCCFVLYHLVRC